MSFQIDADAIVRDKPAEQQNNAKPAGALAKTSKPAGQEFVSSARVALDATQKQVDDKMVNLARRSRYKGPLRLATSGTSRRCSGPNLQWTSLQYRSNSRAGQLAGIKHDVKCTGVHSSTAP